MFEGRLDSVRDILNSHLNNEILFQPEKLVVRITSKTLRITPSLNCLTIWGFNEKYENDELNILILVSFVYIFLVFVYNGVLILLSFCTFGVFKFKTCLSHGLIL